MHSLHLGKKRFKEVDNLIADNFQKAAKENKVKRIIYLGGLGDRNITLSDHLKSRHMVAEILQKGNTPVTVLQAGVIIGSGSASYKMIKNPVQNCTIFLFPPKYNSYCQPIAVRDVIKYLVGCLETIETKGKSYDIGSPNVLTYQMMLKTQADVAGKKKYFIPSFFSSINIYARITDFLTPVPFEVIKSLMTRGEGTMSTFPEGRVQFLW